MCSKNTIFDLTGLKLIRALNTLQRAFDKAEDFMKRILGWYEFKYSFRAAEPEFYHDFQAIRHDPGLHGRESEQEKEKMQRDFSLIR